MALHRKENKAPTEPLVLQPTEASPAETEPQQLPLPTMEYLGSSSDEPEAPEAPSVISEAPELDTLNDAAELLIQLLEGRGAEVLREASFMQAIPLWMHLVGLLQKALDTGEHNTPVIDPSWARNNPAAVGYYGETICACGCNQTFQRRWPGQIYASNECGIRATRLARAGASAPLSRPPVGQEPRMAPRSTIFKDESAGSFDPRVGPPARDGEPGGLGRPLEGMGD